MKKDGLVSEKFELFRNIFSKMAGACLQGPNHFKISKVDPDEMRLVLADQIRCFFYKIYTYHVDPPQCA